MLLLPTLNPPSARRTLRGADFRGISRYITIIIRSIILGDEKGSGGEGAGENCSPQTSYPPALAVANLPGFDSDRPNLFSIIQGPSICIRTRELFRELTYAPRRFDYRIVPIVEINNHSAGHRLSTRMFRRYPSKIAI